MQLQGRDSLSCTESQQLRDFHRLRDETNLIWGVISLQLEPQVSERLGSSREVTLLGSVEA